MMSAEQFEDARRRLQVSKIELSRRLGVHPVTVSRYATGWPIPRTVELALAGLLAEAESHVAAS